MVAVTLWTLYFLGIPLTFWLIDGFAEFKSDDEECADDRESADRFLAIIISLCVSFCWPLFWGLCLVIAIFARFLRLS